MVLDVAIIGSGFGGLGAAIRLQQVDVTNIAIFERARDLGGTWRDNTYPGCRCDVGSYLYSFSFAPNPAWTNTYSFQPEIWQYLRTSPTRTRSATSFTTNTTSPTSPSTSPRDCGDSPRATASISPSASFSRRAAWPSRVSPTSRGWRLHGNAHAHGPVGRTVRARRQTGRGHRYRRELHSSGATDCATRGVPRGLSAHAVVDLAAPRPPGMDRSKKFFARCRLAQRAVRAWGYWRRELMVLGFVKDPRRMTKAETLSREHLERQIKDEALRERFTPHYRLGCKRVLISNDFYPAFRSDNVTLVTEPIATIEDEGRAYRRRSSSRTRRTDRGDRLFRH
jgi:cation diffusion facilitator CzcD-associated flavoprotein CzcO